MANTYTQIHLQFVFAVRYRRGLIDPRWQEQFHRCTTSIIQKNEHKLLQINSMPDHVHLLVGFRPKQSISALIQQVKSDTTKFIRTVQRGLERPFEWQEGYGAFSYRKSDVDGVIRYIQNQQEHHAKKSFLEEYREFLEAFEVDWEEQYIFKEPE